MTKASPFHAGGAGLIPGWERRSHMSHSQNTENRSDTIANSVKTLKMIHTPPKKKASSHSSVHQRSKADLSRNQGVNRCLLSRGSKWEFICLPCPALKGLSLYLAHGPSSIFKARNTRTSSPRCHLSRSLFRVSLLALRALVITLHLLGQSLGLRSTDEQPKSYPCS